MGNLARVYPPRISSFLLFLLFSRARSHAERLVVAVSGIVENTVSRGCVSSSSYGYSRPVPPSHSRHRWQKLRLTGAFGVGVAVEAAKVDRHDGARKGGAGRQDDAKYDRAVAEPPYHPLILVDAVSRGKQAGEYGCYRSSHQLRSPRPLLSASPKELLRNPVSSSFLDLFLCFLANACPTIYYRRLARITCSLTRSPTGTYSQGSNNSSGWLLAQGSSPRELSVSLCRLCIRVDMYVSRILVCVLLRARGSPPTSFPLRPFAGFFLFLFLPPFLLFRFVELYPVTSLSA